MTRRIVLRISGLAKLGLTAAMVGVGLGLWARQGGPDWARVAGGVLLIGGAAVYVIERLRFWRRPRG
jgi:hypothetical protein